MSVREQGLLMAIMEPNGLHDEEFNDWYDLEHIPQISTVTGVLTATRWVAVEGWPRYMACYDLEHVDVLSSESYRQATGGNFTPWSRRMLGRVRGWRRVALAGLDGSAGSVDPTTNVFDVLFTNDADAARQVVAAVSSRTDLVQARAFEQPDDGYGVAIVEAGGVAVPPLELGELGSRLRASSRYVRYHRGEPFHAFHAIDSGAVR
jgi:hypothetical protein